MSEDTPTAETWQQMEAEPETDTRVVLAHVARERRAQDAKWGEQNHGPEVWAVVLGEEIGEAVDGILGLLGIEARLDSTYGRLCRRVLRFRAAGTDSPDGQDAYADAVLAMRDEFVQVAAVAVAACEYIDRRLIYPGRPKGEQIRPGQPHEDPVTAALAEHGIEGSFLDGASRDKVRELADDCSRCAGVAKMIDDAVAHWFVCDGCPEPVHGRL